MSTHSHWWLRTIAVTFAMVSIVAFICTGCEREVEEAPTQVPAVDPRFATAEAMLAHYNSITTRAPVQTNELNAIIYAENETQQRMVRVMRLGWSVGELDWLLWEKFKSGIEPTLPGPMLSAATPATMVKVEAQRAEAKQRLTGSGSDTVHFVKIGDRWWLSGYTYEHMKLPSSVMDQDSLNRATLADLDMGASASAAAASAVIGKINSGAITSVQQARTDFLRTLMEQQVSRSRGG